MDDGREIVDPRVGVPGISDIGSPGDVLTYRGPNLVPRFLPVTGAGLGNVSGPGTTTVGYVPTWSNTTGTGLSAGLPVSTSGAALSLVETDSGGKIAASTLPNTGVTPGPYTNASITVLPDGRLSAASSGTAAGVPEAPAGPPVWGRSSSTWVQVVPIAGNVTMTGPLVLSGAPTLPAGAATKAYADGLVVGLAPLNSPFFTGTPSAPNQPGTDDSTRLATTHWVKAQGYVSSLAGTTLTGDVTGTGLGTIPTTINNTVAPGTYQGITFNNRGLMTAAADQNYTTLAEVGATYLTSSAAASTYLPLAGGTISGMSPGSLTIQRSPSPLPAAIPGTALWINFADAEAGSVGMLLDSYSVPGNLIFRRANGPAGGRTKTLMNDPIGGIASRGYDGSVYSSNGTARIVFVAAQDFAFGAQGTSVQIDTNPINSTTRVTQAKFGPGLEVGVPTGAAPGGMQVGDLNAQGRIMINGVPVATTAGMAGSFLPLTGGTISGTAPGSITINRKTGLPAAAASTNPVVWGVGAVGENPALLVDGIGNFAALVLRRANGTGTSAIALNDVLGQMAVRGYGSTRYSDSGNARFQFVAAENWDDTRQGTYIRFQTIPVGSNGLVDQAVIGPGLTVGMPTPPPDGMQIGDGNFSRVLLNGIALTAGGGGGGPTTLAGDVTGASTATTVEKIRGLNISTTAPTNTQVLAWNATASQWEPTAPSIGASTGTVNAGLANQVAWYASPGNAVSGNAAVTLSAAGSLTINRNTAVLPTAVAGTGVWVNLADAEGGVGMLIDSYANPGNFIFRQARGTGTTKLATASGDVIGGIASRGYDGTNYSPTGTARILFQTLEAFTSGAQGTTVLIDTNPLGSTGRLTQVMIGPGVKIGAAPNPNPADGGMMLGDLVAQRAQISANTAVAPASAYPAVLRVIGPDTQPARLIIDSFGANNSIILRRSNGIAGSPLPVLSGEILGQVLFTGYAGGTYAAPATWLIASASQGWDAANQGSFLTISSIAPSTTTPVDRVVIGRVGGVVVNRAGSVPPSGGTSGDMGPGSLNADSLYINGVAVVAGPSGGTPGGSNTQVQFNNSSVFGGSAGATFNTSSLTGMNIALGSDATGDLYFRGAGGALTRLAAGTSGYLLQSGGPGIAPVWVSVAVGGGTVSGGGASPQLALYTAGNVVSPVTMGGDATINAGGTVSLANTTTARTNIGLGTAATPTWSGATLSASTASLTVQRNAAALPPAIAGTGVWVNFADTDANVGMLLDSYANPSNFIFRQAGGTGTTKLATGSGVVIGGIASRGYDGTNYSATGTARIMFQTLQAFTASAQGTAVLIDTNASGSITRETRIMIGPGVQVYGAGNTPPTGGDLGAGTLNAAGLYVGGVAALTNSGISGMTANRIPLAASATTITSTLAAGTATQVLHGGTPPVWGAVVTADITDANVTYAKIQNVAASRLLGNPTGSAAAPSEISLGTGLSFTTTVLNNTGVTSVGLTMPGSIWAVGGSPVATTGTLAVTVAGTSGGVPYFSSATAMGTSGLLAANAIVLGGGAGLTPATMATGTSGQVLHSAGAAVPTWGAVSLTTEVSGVLQAAQEPAHTGDVTNTAGSLALTIGNGVVSYAKMVNATAASLLLGRGSAAGGGAWQEITLGANLTMTNQVLAAAGGTGSGTVQSSPQYQLPYYDQSGSQAHVLGHAKLTTDSVGSLWINRNASAAPLTQATGAVFWYSGQDNEAPFGIVDAYGTGSPAFWFRKANGTGATPTGVILSDILGGLSWRGWYTGATGFSGATARVQALSIEPSTWTSTTWGTAVQISTVPVGQNSLSLQATFGPGVTIGAPTAQATPTAGDLNAQRLFVQGLPVTAFGSPSVSWLATADPNGAVLFIADRACTVATARAVIVAAQSGRTLQLKKNNSTILNASSGTFDLSQTAGPYTISITAGGVSLIAGDYINITTNGTFTTSAGNVTVYVS